ncbi:TerD family protein [Paenibacillus oenotherae]|uniref:TerD family protein n=1 Tax=Paenibacillus oenotherae TaxID=1435645 RepID=A0ABS7DAF5_9BACL|nr:TerD family protein [Paenibacillus oenotherae]MBW7476866.1 TerD family protein [Paenibacillus oenotherae]
MQDDQLAKRYQVDLTKPNPGVSSAIAGYGSDAARYDGGTGFDFDAKCKDN